jgi:hypothetical protein
VRKAKNLLTKFLTVAALVGLGMAYSAKADSVTLSVATYYAGPTGEIDNPFSVTNSTVGANSISRFSLTTAGAAGNLTLDTTGNPGLTLTSTTAGLYNVTLYGATNTMVTGTTLNTGTYSFSNSQDYFGILATPTQFPGSGSCAIANQYCTTGTSPSDVVTINVAATGLVTITSSSMELVAGVSSPPPNNSVPEIDPKNGMSAFALLAGAVLIMRGRRKKAQEVAV